MTEELRALIARLEAATEGSWILDGDIELMFNPVFAHPPWVRDGGTFHCISEPNTSHDSPEYTTSIDAALTLVPDHMTIHMNERLEGVAGAHVMLIGPSGPFMSDSVVHGEAHLHTLSPLTDFRPVRSLLPLALCIASLRARMR